MPKRLKRRAGRSRVTRGQRTARAPAVRSTRSISSTPATRTSPRTRSTSAGPTAIPAGLKPSNITLRTSTRKFELDPGGRSASVWVHTLQQAAMQWTYIVRNRQRWTGLKKSAERQARRAHDFLISMGLPAEALAAIATEGFVEVEIPYVTEDNGWESRIFPWEYVIAGATSEARQRAHLTVTRRLVTGKSHAAASPTKVLYVESAPENLRDLYTFDTERSLLESNLKASKVLIEPLISPTPTLELLATTVEKLRPDIIHLAGFDSHEGLRLLGGRDAELNVRDGYLLADRGGRRKPVDSETLAKALCADGKHRPLLVAFSINNSAARCAPMALAAGARAAIAIQDNMDDELVELFFGSFYRAWRRTSWNLRAGFEIAWETVRSQSVRTVSGTGLVLWSADSLAEKRATRGRGVKADATETWLPERVPADRTSQVLTPKIEPFAELNYSLLHNREPLFKRFTLINTSAEYDNADTLAAIAEVDVRVELSAGTEVTSFSKRVTVNTPTLDLREQIHLPLISALMRSVYESVNSSLMVEVAWGRTIYRESHHTRLLPVDQWRDNDRDGRWLPSFVLPRDPAVPALIDKAQRYVRVLRDDPSAGFDGYQSFDPHAEDPAGEVDRQVQAIWSMLVHELDLTYINPPPSYSRALDSQRLRTPSIIVQNHCGTCIDLALLILLSQVEKVVHDGQVPYP